MLEKYIKTIKKLRKQIKTLINNRKLLIFKEKLQYTNRNSKWYNKGGKEGGFDMASVFDVACYILNRQGSMTAMKLEKLVYYSQAWSLAWDGKPIFDDDFQAWANGPVCPALFHSHQGVYVIPKNFYDAKGQLNNLTAEQIETIEAVLGHYGDKTPQWLSDLTHKERPWKEARQGVLPGERSDNIISKDIMQDYYGGLH